MKIRLGRYQWLIPLVLMLFNVGACSRESVGQDIVIKVIDESKSSSPFGATKSVRRFGAGIDVYLIPGDVAFGRLEVVSSVWRSEKTDNEGIARFRDVEGVFHVAVDANADTILDASLAKVPSGSNKTITITSYGEGGDNDLVASCDREVYHTHETARISVTGFLDIESPVVVELWHDVAGEKMKLHSFPEKSFAGAVSYPVNLKIDPKYPLTKNSTFDDYLVVPQVYGKYFTGCRFSLREVTDSVVIGNMSLVINSGAAETSTRNVTLLASATGAKAVAFTEDPFELAETLTRFKIGGNFGFQLSDGDGLKVVWAWFYDVDGNFAGPVSDTITLNTMPPVAPLQSLTHVVWNPPGMDDFIYGDAGAVRGGYTVTAYRDNFLNQVLSQVVANADGSFGPMSIGDGSAGNVVKPQDYVYLTATDFFNRESSAVAAYNDSTPPDLRPADMSGSWASGRFAGTTGDVFSAFYTRPFGYPPATDATGGFVDFAQWGGPSNVTMSVLSVDSFSARFTVPVGISVDRSDLRIRMRIHDAAFNSTPLLFSEIFYSIDTIPPNPVDLVYVSGGNQEMFAFWDDDNPDTVSYVWTHTSEVGTPSTGTVNVLTYCQTIGMSNLPCLNFWARITGNIIPFDPGSGSGAYPFTVPNCHWYTLRIQAVDDGGNISAYSNAVSDRVILPAPRFNAWGGLSTDGDGTIVYSLYSVLHGTTSEIHMDTDSGVPYSYASTSFSSPATFASAGDALYIGRIPWLPLRQTYYLNSRAIDDADPSCKSDYAEEMTAVTDLRIEASSDGVAVEETMGGALARVSDFDGDGQIDLLVGAPTPQYVAVVSAGTGARISTFGSFVAPDSYDIPGKPLASADIDNDGKDEFFVGSPIESAGGMFLSGVVRVYDDNLTLIRTLPGDSIGRHFGYSIENLGDIDGDSMDDVAIGGFGCVNADCGYDYGTKVATQGPGQVIIYSGANLSGVAPLVPLATHFGDKAGDFFGVSIAGGKDFNGDGVNDYAIGSPGTRIVVPTEQVRVYSGATHNLIEALWLGSGIPGEARYAAGLAMIDDVNGDGRGELIVGNMGLTISGTVYMLSRFSGFGTYFWWMQSGEPVLGGPGFGSVVAAGGDINGDGFPDVVIGAPNGLQNYFYGPGAAFVIDGRSGRYLYELRGGATDGVVGYSALVPGNVNAGLRDEWVVGAPGSAFGGYQSGRLYILTTDP